MIATLAYLGTCVYVTFYDLGFTWWKKGVMVRVITRNMKLRGYRKMLGGSKLAQGRN